MKNDVDFFVLNVPKMDLRAPCIALGLLNSIAKNNGFKSHAFDSNIHLWHHFLKKDQGYLWGYDDMTLVRAEDFKQIQKEFANAFRQTLIEKAPACKPRIIGISLFSIFSFVPLPSMLGVLREHYPGAKILLGGPGISIRNRNEVEEHLRILKDQNLYDDYIYGESEHAIVDYLSGKEQIESLNSYTKDSRIAEMPKHIPDYSDFDFALYPKKHTNVETWTPGPNKWIYITGSRGCVRSCTFCDVGAIWPKYKYKPGKYIADEMIHQYRTHGVDKFRFTDSLLNGSSRELKDLCERLLEADIDVIWHGQFICRDEKQHPPEYYDMLKKAGLDLVSIGIESGSQKVRYDMGKNFSDEALYYTMEQLDRVGVKVVPLMIVGYPTETEADFQRTLYFLDRLMGYKNIVDINLNNTMRLLPGSPLGNDPGKYGIMYENLEVDHDFTASWSYEDNNFPTRIERFFRFHNRLLTNNLQRSYAGNDLNIYRLEYLKVKQNPDPEFLNLIESVCEGKAYAENNLYRS